MRKSNPKYERGEIRMKKKALKKTEENIKETGFDLRQICCKGNSPI